MTEPKKKYYEKRAAVLVKNLHSRHFDAWYCETPEKALQKALELIPEGASVALPLRRENYSVWKCFLIGQFSGAAEIPAALAGAGISLVLHGTLPFSLSLAAGAMITVAVTELIPEAVGSHKGISVIGILIGFSLMMILDVSLG